MADPGLARFSINQATTPAWSLPEAVEGYARKGVGGIGVWRDKLAEAGTRAAARAIREAGLAVPSLCKSASLTEADPARRRAAMDENRRAVDEAAEIGAGCLVMVCGGVGEDRNLPAARARLENGLAELLPHALACGVALGLEPLHPAYCADRSCLNTLAQAIALCERLGEGTAIVADVYHTWWDPEFEAHLGHAGAGRIASFHLNDWLVPTRDILLDRGMAGDGVIDLAAVRGTLDRIGYDGPFELEIFSRHWWARDPDEVVDIAIARCRPLVGARADGAVATPRSVPA